MGIHNSIKSINNIHLYLKQKILKSTQSQKVFVMDGKMQPPSGSGGRKRGNLTLDLNSVSPKKNRIQNILTSPDVQKLLSQNPSLATPTPSGYGFPNTVTEEQIKYVKGFEEALQKMHQEEIVTSNDTVSAANTLVTLSSGHNIVHPPEQSSTLTLPLSLPNTIPNNPLSRPNSGASGSYDSDTYQVPDGTVKIKDEPDDESLMSPGASGVIPIDMESQERIKLERKRLR